MGGGFAGITPTLDQVLVRSLNATIEQMIIGGTNSLTKFEVRDNLGTPIFTVDTVTPAVTLPSGSITSPLNLYDPTLAEFSIFSRDLNSLYIDSGTGGDGLHLQIKGISIISLSGSYVTCNRHVIPGANRTWDLGVAGTNVFKDAYQVSITLYDSTGAESSKISRSLDYQILDAGAGALGVLIEDGDLIFVGANKGRIIDNGTDLKILYGAGPDFGIGVGCCSGGVFHIDIQTDGIVEITTEQLALTDGAFSYPNRQFCSVFGTLRTSGDVLEVVGDTVSLTTGRLVSVFNNGGGGPGGSPVFIIDKLGKHTIFDSTGVEGATFERTLTDFIMDTGIGGGLSIKIAGTEVIGDNGVSALVLGNTTMAPQLPVLTTAQRNALTGTTGMVIWHTGPPATAQVYTGVAWVNL